MSKNLYLHLFSAVIDLILYKVSDSKEMHNILDYSNFGHVGPQTTESVIMGKMVFSLFLVVCLLENYSKYFEGYTCWLSGERSLPFGLLVKCPVSFSISAACWGVGCI